jgi:MSHA biogenesis protein MshI
MIDFPGLLQRWTSKRELVSEPLVVSWSGHSLAYVRARLRADGLYEVTQSGVEYQADDSMDDFVRRLQELGLKSLQARVMLRPEQYQFMQIDTPAVPPQEWRSAARYQVKDMLEAAVEDVTIDVMRVGNGQHRGAGHLFVAAARTEMLKDVMALGEAMQWGITVIDIQETAQRNIQSVLAVQEGRSELAQAALMFIDSNQVLLTISADDELFYSRRLELPSGQINEPLAQRFVVDIQRSLDAWSRSWSSLVLDRVSVFAAERGAEVSEWLTSQLGMAVDSINTKKIFPLFSGVAPAHQLLCLPLLGILLRTESPAL